MSAAKQPTFQERISAAIEAGDRRLIADLYHEERGLYGIFNGDRANLSDEIREASMNAAKKDSLQFQKDILAEILSIQTMLLHRVEESIRIGIARHDKTHTNLSPWGDLPDDIAGVMLPRYGKIAAEIVDTIKLMRKLESSPAKSSPAKPELAKDDNKDASA